MIKEIVYNGVTTTPSEYGCKDGDLAYSEGVGIDENGIVGELQPSIMFALDEGEKVMHIHKMPQRTNYILWKEKDEEDEESVSGLCLSWHTGAHWVKGSVFMELDDEPYDVGSIGNTLVVAAKDGLRYALFREVEGTMKYVELPKFPELDVRFGLKGDYQGMTYPNFVYDSSFPKSGEYPKDEGGIAGIGTIVGSFTSDDVIGDVDGNLHVGDDCKYFSGNYGVGNYALEMVFSYHKNSDARVVLVGITTESGTIPSGTPINIDDLEQYGTQLLDTDVSGGRAVMNFSAAATYKKIAVIWYLKNNNTDVVTFALYNNGTATDTLLYGYKDSSDESNGRLTDSYTTVRGAINRFYKKFCVTSKRFMHPFFARVAFRMYDGSYIVPSAPALMLPTTGVAPLVRYIRRDSDNKINFTVSGLCCDLFMKIGYDSEVLSAWKDLITDVVVAVSKPIIKYNSAVEDKDEIRDQMFVDTYPNEQVKGAYSIANIYRDGNERFGVRYLTELEESYGINQTGGTKTDNNKDRHIYNKMVRLPQFDDARELIEGASSFYIVKEYSLNEVEDIFGDGSLVKVDMSAVDMEALVNRKVLDDETASLHGYTPRNLFCYNGRLHMADYQQTMFKGWKPCEFHPKVSHNGEGSYAEVGARYRAIVELHENGKSMEVDVPFSATYGELENAFESNKGHYPNASGHEWFFYPSVNAKKATIYKQFQGDNQYYKCVIDLTSHPYLNGAYWFDNFINMAFVTCTADEATRVLPYTAEVDKSNFVKMSEVNPFVFTDTRTYQFDSEVVGMSAAVKALSTGQHGDFDLYVFTERDGVWSLKINSEGAYTRQVPDTRDCVISPKSITQIDTSVLFATARGIMEIHGSQSSCVNVQLEKVEWGNVSELQGISALGMNASDITVDFKEFVKGCEMVYDYKGQRIIVFNSEKSYCYVLSLKTKKWSISGMKGLYSVNAYPDALVVMETEDGEGLYDVSNDAAQPSSAVGQTKDGLVVTRAVKLDDGNSFKRINVIRQNGVFCKDDIEQILYGSNDLKNWFVVGSASGSRIAISGGSPYRFFKWAVKTMFDSDEECLVSATVSYDVVDGNGLLV